MTHRQSVERICGEPDRRQASRWSASLQGSRRSAGVLVPAFSVLALVADERGGATNGANSCSVSRSRARCTLEDLMRGVLLRNENGPAVLLDDGAVKNDPALTYFRA